MFESEKKLLRVGNGGKVKRREVDGEKWEDGGK